MSEVTYDIIRRKFPDVFCIDNLRSIYKTNKDDLEMSFVDFLLYIEDYYLLKYSSKLSKTAWWLFTLLRHLVREEGFVKLSHSEIIGYFCTEQDDATISKPTFFKYIDELESFGVIKRFNNKKLFATTYQNDSNTYVVINKMNEILEVCKQTTDRQSFHDLVKGTVVSKKSKVKKIQSGKSDTETYNEISEYYRDVFSVLEDFFKFLGSPNKSGNIALSRKVKILSFIYERDVAEDDVTYAVSATIKKGVNSEKYFFAIIRNIYDEPEVNNSDDNEIRKKYMAKNNGQFNSGMTLDEYNTTRHQLVNDEFKYREVLSNLDSVEQMNEYENKLYNAAMVISKKMKLHDKYSERCADRRRILKKKGIYEQAVYDKKWNRILTWFYDVDESPVPLNVMKQIKKEFPYLFGFYKYEVADWSVYDGF